VSAPVTLRGRFTRDPELLFSAAGKPIAKFSVVTSDRVKNQQSGEWEDSNTSFWDCVAFGKIAENVCESFAKGSLVIVVGKVKQETWEKDGQKRSTFKVTVNDIGASVQWDTVNVINSNGGRVQSRQSQEDFDKVPF
jgi:single-strand DNA-binding protein